MEPFVLDTRQEAAGDGEAGERREAGGVMRRGEAAGGVTRPGEAAGDGGARERGDGSGAAEAHAGRGAMASGAEPPQGEAELRAAGGASSDAHGAAGHPRAGGRQPGEAELPQLLRLRWPGVSAGFTTRRGGVSRPPFASLNGGLHVGDDPADVVANRERLAASIGRPFAACTYAEQVHGTKVLVATHEHRGRGRATREDAVQGTDAFVTAERGLVLCTQFADCVPLFIHDPVRQVVGLAHAGWKGSVLNIAQATVSAMARAFGSRPQELRAAVGPSIGVCCYEVDATVAGRVREALAAAGAAPQAEAAVLQPRPNGKFMLNLQEFNRNLLEQAGILSPCIEVTQLCTSCRTDLFFSHRKEGGSTGRMIAWIALE